MPELPVTNMRNTMTPFELAAWEGRLQDGTLFQTVSERHGARWRYRNSWRCVPCRGAEAAYQHVYRARVAKAKAPR